MPDDVPKITDLTAITAGVVAAFVSHNSLPQGELVAVIQSVHAGLATIARRAPTSEAPLALTPAVPIPRSIRPDHLICLDDGKKFKSLRRHLGTLGMTPEHYRAKWGLPHDYPMVAPNYSAMRSALAKGHDVAPSNGSAPAARRKRGRPIKA